MSYENEIAEAKQMIELLRHKLAGAEEHLRVLETLSKSGSDPFFDLLRKELNMSGPVKTGQRQKPLTEGRSVFGVSADAIDVLRFIGEEGKALVDVISYMRSKGKISEGGEARVRKLMYDLKHVHEVLDSPKRGFYKLNIKGVNVVGLNDEI